RITCRPGNTVLCVGNIDPSADWKPVLARTRQLISFRTHNREWNVDVNLTILDGKRKRKLKAFFRFVLSKIPGWLALAWMRIQGSTFLIYDVGYFNPICVGLQTHPTNQIHTPWCRGLDTDRRNERAGFFDRDAHRAVRAHLRCVSAFK